MNALYDYYAYQFADAGSPSKVQETVGSGLLPNHIDYILPDIASLFKKILIGLPGGLLGSIELFEAFRNIFVVLNADHEHTGGQDTLKQARLIALAISSVTSSHRIHLIQAVLGLVAYFGDSAEKARKEMLEATDQSQETKPLSELMGHQSLGVVLGPLLVGDLMDVIEVAPVEGSGIPRSSTDSAGKAAKKINRATVTNKLEKDITLSAHVDRANLTANIMERLLKGWTDVVRELQKIHRTASLTPLPSANDRTKKAEVPSDIALAANDPEEEVLLLDMLRGRPLPQDFEGEANLKRKVRVSRSKSPMMKKSMRASEGNNQNPSSKVGTPDRNTPSLQEYAAADTDIRVSSVRIVTASSSIRTGSHHGHTPPHSQTNQDPRTRSDIAMDQMSMGTILPRLQDSPVTPSHRDRLRSLSRLQTPNKSLLSSETPETALRDTSLVTVNADQTSRHPSNHTDKPLPLIGESQRAESSRHPSFEDLAHAGLPPRYPSRHSSLPRPAFDPLPQFAPETFSAFSGYGTIQIDKRNPRSRSSTTVEISASRPHDLILQANRDSHIDHMDGRDMAHCSNGETQPVLPAETEPFFKPVHRVFAHIITLPSSKSNHDDPFMSSAETSPERISGTSNPTRDADDARNPEGRSSSIIRSTRVLQNSSEYSDEKELMPLSHPLPRNDAVVPDSQDDPNDANLVTPTQATVDHHEMSAGPSNTLPLPQSRSSSQLSHGHARKSSGNLDLPLARTRPLSVYSLDSLRRVQLADEPPVAHHISGRGNLKDTISEKQYAVALNESVVAAQLESTNTLKRTSSTNATLLNEIARLKRVLDKNKTELNAMARSLAAARDVRETGASLAAGAAGDEGGGSIGSSKGTLSEEVRVAKKEMAEWKRRAEWAEGRLAVVEVEKDTDGGKSS